MTCVTTIEETLPKVGHLIEASTFEQNILWERYHQKVEYWEECQGGQLARVGYVGGSPVCISLTYAKVNKVLVCFWHATSNIVDYPMISAWLKENIDVGRYGNDAQNNGLLSVRRR